MQDANRQGTRGQAAPSLRIVPGLPPAVQETPATAPAPANPPRVLAVTGAASGVGTSVLTTSLGLAMAELGRRVLVVDEPGRRLRARSERSTTRPDLVSRLVREASRYDFLLVEIPAGRGMRAEAVASRCDLVVLVTTPDPAVALEARAGLVFFSSLVSGRLNVVVNRAPSEANARDTYRRLLPSSALSRRTPPTFLGGVPEDPAVHRAVSIQTPFVVHDPLAPSSCSVRALAWRLLSGTLPEGGERAMDPGTGFDGFPDPARAA